MNEACKAEVCKAVSAAGMVRSDGEWQANVQEVVVPLSNLSSVKIGLDKTNKSNVNFQGDCEPQYLQSSSSLPCHLCKEHRAPSASISNLMAPIRSSAKLYGAVTAESKSTTVRESPQEDTRDADDSQASQASDDMDVTQIVQGMMKSVSDLYLM